jgi:chaperone required for assembly of F1-ATPase
MRRFYKEVSVAEDFRVLLDGRPIKTPMRATLALPTRMLAEAVAEEWRGQGEKIAPETLPLTKLANTAIDRVVGREEVVIDQILAYANDLLCYRAEAPADLVARQNEGWNPLLDWAAERYGARLFTRVGIAHIAQPEEAVEAFRHTLAGHDPFVLTALHAAATLCGSLVLALALADGRLGAEEAFALSHLDERYQAEKWGADGEAAKRARAMAGELDAAARFMRLARTNCPYPSTSSG